MVVRHLAKKKKERQKSPKQRPEVDRHPPAQVQNRVRCPYCRTDDVVSYGYKRHTKVRYYRCRVCGDPQTCDWTRFKVVVGDPLAQPERVDPSKVPE